MKPAQVAEIRDLAGRGLMDTEIASALGLRQHQVWQARQLHGIPAGRPRADSRIELGPAWFEAGDPEDLRERPEAAAHLETLGVRFEDDARAAKSEARVQPRRNTWLHTESSIAACG